MKKCHLPGWWTNVWRWIRLVLKCNAINYKLSESPIVGSVRQHIYCFIADPFEDLKLWKSTELLAIVLGFASPSSLPNWLPMLYCVFTLFSGDSKYPTWQEVNQWIKMLSSVCKRVLVFPCRVRCPAQMPNSRVINHALNGSSHGYFS